MLCFLIKDNKRAARNGKRIRKAITSILIPGPRLVFATVSCYSFPIIVVNTIMEGKIEMIFILHKFIIFLFPARYK